MIAGAMCRYPLHAYPSPPVAFSALVSDANFACPALQIDRWTSRWVPTFAYEFNDDHAPLRYPPPPAGPPVATHKSEFPYLFDLPDAPLQEPLRPRPAGACGQHASGLGELRGQRQPSVGRRGMARLRRPGRRPAAIPRAATATGRDGLRRPAPLRVLGRPVTNTASLAGCSTDTGPGRAAGRA
jgi:para-nitrobenzyl esterase